MGMYIKLLRQQLSSLCQLRCATYSTFATNLKNTSSNEASALDQFLDSDGYTWDSFTDIRTSDTKPLETSYAHNWRDTSIPEFLSNDIYHSFAKFVNPQVMKSCAEGFNYHFLYNTDLSQYVNQVTFCDISNTKPCVVPDRKESKDSLLLSKVKSSPASVVQSSPESDKSVKGAKSTDSPGDDEEKKDGPTLLQLQDVMNYYIATVPSFHRASGENFRLGMHHKQIVFENNFYPKPIVKRGIHAYRNYLFKINLLATFAYVHYSYEIVSLRSNRKEGSVILHWRVRLLSNTSFMTSLVPRVLRGSNIGDQYKTMDGISTFYVDSDGKIFKHKVERLTPLNEPISATEKIASKILSNAVPKVNFTTQTKGHGSPT